MSRPPRVLPVGDSALTVEFGDAIDVELNARVRALDRSLLQNPAPGVLEAVPTYRSLLVHYDPRVADFALLREILLSRSAQPLAGDVPGALHLVPTLYGGEAGPDLAEVARLRGLRESEVIALHSGPEYRAFMLGFTAGFAYLGLLPPGLETTRRSTPRVRVPAGSVAVAGRQTAIYPVASPGGWNLLGRTSLRLFDPHAEPPALILPGDRVRFQPVRELPPPIPTSPSALSAMGSAALEVLEPGLLTTVQDGGRFGLRRLGVTASGPMDAPSHRAANLLVGNTRGAAALECTAAGPTLRFLAATRFAITGADLGAVLHRNDLGPWPVPRGSAVLARPGNVLELTGRREGCRAYVAFAGAIEVPAVLGSRSTNLTSGWGGFDGRRLRSGDLLRLGAPSKGEAPLLTCSPPQPPPPVATVRVVLGPQDDHLTPEALSLLLSQTFRVAAASDRVGCRLSGPRLEHRGQAEIVTDGMVFGSVQIPPDGQPIVLMADGPTTGGYPKPATVITADLPLLAQVLPGGEVRFEAVTIQEAQEAARRLG